MTISTTYEGQQWVTKGSADQVFNRYSECRQANQNQINKHATTLSNLQQEVSRLKGSEANLKSYLQSDSDMQNRNQALSQQITQLQSEKSFLQKEVDASQTEFEQKTRAVEVLSIRVKELHIERVHYTQEIELLKDRTSPILEQLENKKNDQHHNQATLESLSAELLELRRRKQLQMELQQRELLEVSSRQKEESYAALREMQSLLLQLSTKSRNSSFETDQEESDYTL